MTPQDRLNRITIMTGRYLEPICTFDWITKKANFQKILEGNYNS